MVEVGLARVGGAARREVSGRDDRRRRVPHLLSNLISLLVQLLLLRLDQRDALQVVLPCVGEAGGGDQTQRESGGVTVDSFTRRGARLACRDGGTPCGGGVASPRAPARGGSASPCRRRASPRRCSPWRRPRWSPSRFKLVGLRFGTSNPHPSSYATLPSAAEPGSPTQPPTPVLRPRCPPPRFTVVRFAVSRAR